MSEYDIIVVGAGIAGAGIAAHLPAAKSVLLLEQETQPGFHSTGRSAALFIESYGNAPIRELNRRSLPLFLAPERYGIDGALFSPRGLLSICQPGQEAAFAELLAENPKLQRLSTAEACDHVPLLHPEQCVQAAYEPEAHDIDVDRLHRGWLKQAKQQGQQLHCQAAVQAADYQDGRWRLHTTAGEFQGKVLVNAAGAWADELAQLAGIQPIGLTAKRRSMAVLPLPQVPNIHGWPMFGDVGENWYAKPEAGRLLVSPADEDPVPAGDAFVDDMVLAEGIDRFEQAVDLSVERVDSSWAGLRSFVADKTPVAGFDPQHHAFFWLAGQGGYGIQTAPALSALAADLLLGQADPQDSLIAQLAPQRLR